MEQSERPATGVSRSQHVLHVVPQLWDAIIPVLTGALERVDPDAAEPQLLVVTPDNDAAMEVARLAAGLESAEGRRILPVSEGGRAARLLRARPAPVVVGSAGALAELVGATALKLTGLKAVLLVWADEIVERTPSETLDTLFTDVPREAARLATAGAETPELEAFVERQMFRARRASDAPAAAEGAPIDVEVLSAPAGARATTLARLLDELDPPSAAIVARDGATAEEAQATLDLLGYTDDGDVRVVEDAPEEAVALAVLYDAPREREELDAVRAVGAQRIVVFATAREASHLRGLLAGGKARPLQLGATAKKAREREERLRGELRAQLEAGIAARDLIALEPLTAEYDALEIAAAALRLMERARQSKAGAGAATGAAAAGGERAHTVFKRIFMTLGTMDGASPRDVVGAVLNEAGLSKEQVGKVEMRDSHTLVEVASDQVERVAGVMDGKTIRGRRINARPDMDRSEREGRGERPPRGDRPDRAPRGDRGDRPPRAGGFTRDRGDRPPRAGGFSRDRGERGGERPARGGFTRDRGERSDRPARGGFDRDRGPRAGGFDRDRGERPSRGGFDRGGDRPRGGGGFRGRDEGPRNPFGGERREVGGERVDFNERAERLKRSKRTPRPRTDGWSPAEDSEA